MAWRNNPNPRQDSRIDSYDNPYESHGHLEETRYGNDARRRPENREERHDNSYRQHSGGYSDSRQQDHYSGSPGNDNRGGFSQYSETGYQQRQDGRNNYQYGGSQFNYRGGDDRRRNDNYGGQSRHGNARDVGNFGYVHDDYNPRNNQGGQDRHNNGYEHNYRGYGDRGYQNQHDFRSGATFRSENRTPAPERAPRDWEPAERDIDELMDDIAQKVEECQISGDQEVEIRNSPLQTRLTSWANSGFHPKILQNLERLKYTNVRTIQAAMIPQIMAGYDVIGQAETSAGKTAAFGLPIVDYILKVDAVDRSESKMGNAPFALILAPTRELAGQIFDSLRLFAKDTGVYVRLSHGQQDRGRSFDKISLGCDILIGTAGRIMDLITKGDITMSKLKYLVLDEADRLLNENYQDQVSHLRVIFASSDFKKTDATRQTLMISATFNRTVESIAANLMKPIAGETDLVRIVLANGRLSNRVNLIFYETSGGLIAKQSKLREILLERNDRGNVPKTLIFVQKKVLCDTLAVKISQFGQFSAQTLHGDRSQDSRDKYINDFKTNRLNVLVCTDVLSRGIDVPDLERVINFDLPKGSIDSATDTFIHRSGRTGRMHSGICISFVDTVNENDRCLASNLLELVKSQGRDETIPEFLRQIARENTEQAELLDNGDGFGQRQGGFGGSGRGSFGGSEPLLQGFGKAAKEAMEKKRAAEAEAAATATEKDGLGSSAENKDGEEEDGDW